MSRSPLYTVLAAAVLFLILVPLGTSVFILGFIHGDSPCILCWAQRIGMALVALIGLFILRYGPRPKYVGLGVLVGAWGVFMAVRHSSLHLSRDIGQGFAVEMLGAHTYVWSFAVFWVCIVVMAAMLMRVPAADLQPAAAPRPLRAIDRVAMVTYLVVIAGTIAQAFASTGPPPFVGQSDPVRFSFNPRYWVWSMDEFSSARISLRGRWNVELPDVTTADPSPDNGPLRNPPPLAVADRRALNLGLNGTPTDLAYDAATNRFLLTTEHGVYLADAPLQRVEKYTVVDPLFAVDLGRFAGAAFLDGNRLLAVTENKSYVILKESATGDARRNFRYFLESPTAFDEVTRSRFATLRAKMSYVMATAADPDTQSIYTVTVPNSRTRRWVVSRFDASDRLLSEEFVPKLAPSFGTPPQGQNPLDAYFITAATIAGGRLYALSAAHSTLLTIDLASHTVVAAHTIPGLAQPTGIAIKGTRLFIVGRDGTLTAVDVPAK
jgi:disulfide bond formation protein DsbB